MASDANERRWVLSTTVVTDWKPTTCEVLDLLVRCAPQWKYLDLCAYNDTYFAYADEEHARAVARHARDDLGLEFPVVHIPAHGMTMGANSPDPAQRPPALEAVAQAFRNLSHFRPEAAVVHVDVDWQDEDGWADAAGTAARGLLDLARSHGMRLAIENTKGPSGPLVALVRSMDEKDLGFCLDTGHAFLYDELDYCVQEMDRRLFVIHAQDTPDKEAGDAHLPPFYGSIPWDRIAPVLARQDPIWDLEVYSLNRGDATEETLTATVNAASEAKTRLLEIIGRA